MLVSLPLIRRRRLLVGISLLPGLAAHAHAPVRVGSKIDTEGKLLGHIMVLALEAHHINTENKLSLGNTKIVRAALLAGEIDLYPEYTGNAAFMLGADHHKAWKDARAGYELAKKLDFEKNKIVWLEPAHANNTWAIAVRKDLATAHQLNTMDDLGRYIAKGGAFKLAASAEFMERADALPAFQAAYGFKLRADQALVLAGGDTATTIKAAAEKTSGVNAAMAYGTDGPLAALGLVVMEDTKSVQAVYAPAPLIRESVLKRYPAIATILSPIFKSLDRPTLQMLNARIQLEGQDPRKVASAYLHSQGFLK
ncbi:MAG: ABC transporter substrate-binding protein [Betaproteobacteria bacterium]|jgi:osmoprotectant transport system substrate-binding protein|nr:ABC transporter substrate-binding protein [Betaproteobacteria bacterium]NBU43168.1 ABC transporter substrate-binding protein [Betaproteobacteria bacterium]NDF64082.1 ABC transporter substrate-binding protein [Betaproteobacteria bacterium]